MASQFIPKELIPRTFGAKEIVVYPQSDDNTPPAEVAHGIFILNASLKNASHFTDNERLLALGQHKNSTTTVTAAERNLLRHFNFNNGLWDWQSFDTTVLGFHLGDGTAATTAGTDANKYILKEVKDGAVGECRPEGVTFVQLRYKRNLSSMLLDKIRNNSPRETVQISYFAELPQSSKTVKNGTSVNRELVTWQGAADLGSLSEQEVQAEILAKTNQKGPAFLLSPSMGMSVCRLDTEGMGKEIRQQIVPLIYDTAISQVFDEMCPNLMLNSTSAVENCKQSYTTSDGIKTCMPTQQFHRSFKACAAGLLLDYQVDGTDLISLFYNNMEPLIKDYVTKRYTKHGQIQSRLSSEIKTELRELLRLGTEAEEYLRDMDDLQ